MNLWFHRTSSLDFVLEWMVFPAFLLGTCVVVFVRGGVDERRAAAAMVLATVISPFLQSGDFAGLQRGLLVVDLFLLAILFWIALQSAAFWPMWAAGFHLTGVGCHLAVGISGSIVPAAYAETLAFWSYASVACLLAGTWKEIPRGGSCPDY